jgi:hypothetical protein
MVSRTVWTAHCLRNNIATRGYLLLRGGPWLAITCCSRALGCAAARGFARFLLVVNALPFTQCAFDLSQQV